MKNEKGKRQLVKVTISSSDLEIVTSYQEAEHLFCECKAQVVEAVTMRAA